MRDLQPTIGRFIGIGCRALLLISVSVGCTAEGNSPSAPVAADQQESTTNEPATTSGAETEEAVADVPEATANASSRPTDSSAAAVRTAPGEKALEITFDDLKINMQPDVVFRPWMLTERAQELDGRRVRVPGYMYAALDRFEDIDEFILIRNLECKFGPGAQADHLVLIQMVDGRKTSYPGDKIIHVEGVLRIEPFVGTDGNTWAIYKLTADDVSTRRF